MALPSISLAWRLRDKLIGKLVQEQCTYETDDECKVAAKRLAEGYMRLLRYLLSCSDHFNDDAYRHINYYTKTPKWHTKYSPSEGKEVSQKEFDSIMSWWTQDMERERVSGSAASGEIKYGNCNN